jgi:hypothetical protein
MSIVLVDQESESQSYDDNFSQQDEDENEWG